MQYLRLRFFPACAAAVVHSTLRSTYDLGFPRVCCGCCIQYFTQYLRLRFFQRVLRVACSVLYAVLSPRVVRCAHTVVFAACGCHLTGRFSVSIGKCGGRSVEHGDVKHTRASRQCRNKRQPYLTPTPIYISSYIALPIYLMNQS